KVDTDSRFAAPLQRQPCSPVRVIENQRAQITSQGDSSNLSCSAGAHEQRCQPARRKLELCAGEVTARDCDFSACSDAHRTLTHDSTRDAEIVRRERPPEPFVAARGCGAESLCGDRSNLSDRLACEQ